MGRPGIKLQEIQEELLNSLSVNIHISNICRFLQKSGFTRQKLRITATQRDDFLRQQYISEVSIYSPEMLIFLDETGTDRRNTLRHYGYSIERKANCESSAFDQRRSPIWHSFYVCEWFIRCEGCARCNQW